MAVRGLRTFSLGLSFCCLTTVLRNCYQGTGRVHRMEAISVLDNAVLPILAALALSRVAGVNGAWFLFLTTEALTTLGILACVWLEKRRITLRAENVLLLRDSFGVPESDRLEANLRDLGEVMDFSRSAADFCRIHGGGKRLAAHLALCVEEMGANIVTHGVAPDGRSNLSIRLQVKDGYWTLRFRDDCFAFDPVSHIANAGAPDESVGIRLAMRIADEARYTYSMNLNNLTLVLRQAA